MSAPSPHAHERAWLAELAQPHGETQAAMQALTLATVGRCWPSRQHAAALARLQEHGSADADDVRGDLLRALPPTLSESAAVDAAGQRLHALGARISLLGHAGYPQRLAQLWPELGAPLWLFVCAPATATFDGPAVAIVGSRMPSLDGVDTARELAALLARHGITVVSGMARGIDEAAHEGALAAGGRTVGVLGTGFGVDYPYRRGGLRQQVMHSGGLISELAPDVGPRGPQFLWRNRIVSGLVDAVVVVEGRARSGALATARLAGEQGREVWAVPGSLHQPTARAPLDLIRDGARPLTRLDEILEVFADGFGQAPSGGRGPDQNVTGPTADDRRAATAATSTAANDLLGRAPLPAGGAASAVASALSAVPASVDDLQRLTGLALPLLLSTLAELAAAGHARTTPRGWIGAPHA